MKKSWSVLPVLAGTLLTVSSCYPGDVTSLQQIDIVVTAHDETVNFTSFSTYVLLDSVMHIDLEDNNNDDLLNRDSDALILSQIRSNIEALGYTEEANPATTAPDVFLMVGALAVTNTQAYVSYPWYDWYGWYPYYGCCGPGYGYYYPWAPTVDVVRYNTGTLVITMIDPTREGVDPNTISVIWVGGINGLLEGSAASLATRVTAAINQAFDQSSYLRTN